MPFHSLDYTLFFAVAVVAFYATPPRLRWATLLVAAAAFLGRVSPLHLAVALAFAGVNFVAALGSYTDLALGAARVLGRELQPNFDRPFAARSLSDFWRRWHISLSSWTNDYVFKPLSMFAASRTVDGGAAMGLSIVVTFTVLGLWHGPRWGYLVFGLLHGVAVAILALTQRRRQRLLRRLPPQLADRLGQGATLVFYALSCVFFRAGSVGDGLYIVGHVWPGAGQLSATGEHLLAQQQPQLALLAALGLVVVALRRWGRERERHGWRLLAPRPRWQRWLVEYSLVAAILLLGVFDVPQFVYVQF